MKDHLQTTVLRNAKFKTSNDVKSNASLAYAKPPSASFS